MQSSCKGIGICTPTSASHVQRQVCAGNAQTSVYREMGMVVDWQIARPSARGGGKGFGALSLFVSVSC
eukprot:4616474-Lingulodinium_polyedra.AAC.1